MELVKTKEDILTNIKNADLILHKGSPKEKEYLLEKISKGRCYVVVKGGDDYKFYPSKYIGYKDNSPSNYENALDNTAVLPFQRCSNDSAKLCDFDGRMSNAAINKILKCSCQKDYELSEKFVAYCKKLGINGSNKKKFWKNIIEL